MKDLIELMKHYGLRGILVLILVVVLVWFVVHSVAKPGEEVRFGPITYTKNSEPNSNQKPKPALEQKLPMVKKSSSSGSEKKVEQNQFVVTITSPDNGFVVTITSPDNGSEVGREMVVRGTALIRDDNHLWLLVRRHDFAPLWWPQREATINPKTHQWSATAVFGGQQDIGWDFDIGVITVDADGHRELMAYWQKAMQTGDWKPIEIPTNTSPPRIVKVKKGYH